MEQSNRLQLAVADLELQVLAEIFHGQIGGPATRNGIAANDCGKIGHPQFPRLAETVGKVAESDPRSCNPHRENEWHSRELLPGFAEIELMCHARRLVADNFVADQKNRSRPGFASVS